MKFSLIILTCIVLLPFLSSAQSQATVNMSEGGYGMLKTSISADYEYGWGATEDCFAAKISYEFFRNKNFTITANSRYTSTEISFGDGDLSNGFDPENIDLNGTHIFGQTGVTSTFHSKLWGKPFMALGMANAEWSRGGFARVSGIAMGILMLRANKSTQFGIGPLVMINTSSKIPAFLVFMYRHRFDNKWSINLYGGMFNINYAPTANNLFSLGADIDVKAFYFKPHNKSLPDKCRFTSTSFRPLTKFRRHLISNFYFDLKCGVSIKMSCRANGVAGSKEYFDCHQKISPFLNAGVSCTM